MDCCWIKFKDEYFKNDPHRTPDNLKVKSALASLILFRHLQLLIFFFNYFFGNFAAKVEAYDGKRSQFEEALQACVDSQ